MRPKEFIFTFFKSLNPDAYKEIVNNSLKKSLGYFFMLIAICILIGASIMLFRGFSVSGEFDNKLDKFERLNLTTDIVLKEPILLSNLPKIRLDLTENATPLRDESLVITRDALFIRKFSPDLFRLSLYKVEKKDITGTSDVLSNRNTYRWVFIFLFLLAIPSIIVFTLLFVSVKYLFLVAVIGGILFAIAKLRKRKPHYKSIFKIGLYAATTMIFMELVLSNFFSLGNWPFYVFVILFVVGQMMTTEKQFKLKKKIFTPPEDKSDGIL